MIDFTRIAEVMQWLTERQPELERYLHGQLLGSFLSAQKKTAQPLFPSPMLFIMSDYIVPENDPILTEFPGITGAVNWLTSRNLLTYRELRQANLAAKQRALEIAGEATTDTIGRIRDLFADDIRTGGTKQEFTAKVREFADVLDVSDMNLDTYYRTYVGQAYSAGQKAMLEHPLVADEFPYRLWTATHDSRTRPDHLAMEKHGQNGTAVYRADDPMWQTLYPPAGWNCRCVAIALSVKDAAMHGSQEAKEWLRTGEAPAQPEYAAVPYPLRLPDGWVGI